MLKKESGDIFADIALQRIEYRDDELIQPKPPELPEKYLFADSLNSEAVFRPGKKMNSYEEFAKELKRVKNEYTIYMRDLAPKLESMRTGVTLDRFNWKIETPEDRKEFCNVLEGKEKWEEVRIPHYGEPLGKKATYYRTEFELTDSHFSKGALFIIFKGVDYRAHVFINNSYLGSHEGFFAPFEFEFYDCARKGKNILVVKVENDIPTLKDGDKIYGATGPGYDDPERGWHHCPPAMGIFQDVFVEARSRLSIKDVFVRPDVENSKAEAWVEIYNCDIEEKEIMLEVSVYGQNFEKKFIENMIYCPQTIQIAGLGDLDKELENKTILKMSAGINYLRIPYEIDDIYLWSNLTPWLYQLQLKLVYRGKVVDTYSQQFGMRSFKMETQSNPKGRIYLNGQPIRLRGANTMGAMQQSAMRKDWEQLIDDILIAKICNLNFLRFTQRPVQSEIYDYCDRLGMMTQTDLPLFGSLRRNLFCEAIKQAEEMERHVRRHPCNIMISFINEPFPNANSKPHRNLTRSELESFFEAAGIVVLNCNPDRVIKYIDGDYDPPANCLPDNHCYNLWYNGHGIDIGMLNRGFWQFVKRDWYYGCGEFGAEGLDPVNLMKKKYPSEWLPGSPEEEKEWTPDNILMAQTGKFHYFWYDTPQSLEEWVNASWEHQQFTMKIIAGAFRRDNRMNSFAVHLLIDAFPSGWMKALVDYERTPKPAYYTYRDMLTPLMTNLRADRCSYYDDERINIEAWICNDMNTKPENAYICWFIELREQILYSGKTKADIRLNCSTFQGYISFQAPHVDERESINVRFGLLDDNNVLHDTCIQLNVFSSSIKEHNLKVCIVGNKEGSAVELTKELRAAIESLENDKKQIILIQDFKSYKEKSDTIDMAVENGSSAIFITLEPGEHIVSGKHIKVVPCTMGPRHFVSRATGHPLVKDFKDNDFKFWYDSSKDMITPILDAVFCSEDFIPVLVSGNKDNNSKYSSFMVVGERKYGKGRFIICQLKLENKLNGNPAARIFANRLLSL
ncbi:MAG TPA: glycoside hydrolase family 2 TIM barrel-domain containing protein [Clostridiales bacterium]|nr:glycoside hydrolase family 2 TIM barrel-domain containing protein [Clostridiales bacterium]